MESRLGHTQLRQPSTNGWRLRTTGGKRVAIGSRFQPDRESSKNGKDGESYPFDFSWAFRQAIHPSSFI